MPEEKVTHDKTCFYDPLTGRGNPCSCGAAADAGPRQPEPHSSQIHTDLTVRCHRCKETVIWRYLEGRDQIEIFHCPVPPVPQEAAPAPGTVATFMDMRLDTTMPVGQVDVQDSKGRRTIIPATAPDSAMRVASEFIESRLIVPFLHGDEKHQEWLREETRKWIPDLAALIREAGSERERRLLNWFIKYAEDAEKSWTKDGERTVTAMSWGQAVSEFRAETSRLLGGESK